MKKEISILLKISEGGGKKEKKRQRTDFVLRKERAVNYVDDLIFQKKNNVFEGRRDQDFRKEGPTIYTLNCGGERESFAHRVNVTVDPGGGVL